MRRALGAVLGLSLLAGCATQPGGVARLSADPVDYATWSCARIRDQIDAVQQRAADIAWQIDGQAGQHMVGLGVGLTVFWPALMAMQPDGAQAAELAQLKAGFEALQVAARRQACARPGLRPSTELLVAMTLQPGERLVYEERRGVREPLHGMVLAMTELRRNEAAFELQAEGPSGVWRQDLAGNVLEAPGGSLQWRQLLRRDLGLGEVLSGAISVSGDGAQPARLRGQVVAVGPQLIGGRRFDAAVIELFGDVPLGEASTWLEGAMAVDRHSGLLLRLDLHSANPDFRLQRRLVRVEEKR